MAKKQTTTTSLHDKTIDELMAMVAESTRKLAEARLQKKVGKYQGSRISLVADDLARVKTILRKKQLEAKV